MSIETTENFLRALRSFVWPDPPTVCYRLYHDAQGLPLFYTMEELPGTYIEVDQVTYVHAPRNVIVKDGKLQLVQTRKQVSRLVPDTEIGTCCHPKDVCIVVDCDQSHQKWRSETNDVN